jgi:hypothetical protein
MDSLNDDIVSITSQLKCLKYLADTYIIGVCMVGYFAKPNYIQTKTRYMDLDT